jgi:hypothetical protein
MSNTTTTTETVTFTIAGVEGAYTILRNGVTLTWPSGYPRYFSTRGTARKRISRERSGQFHA